MEYKKLIKYVLRFLFLQTLLTALTIYYYDNYLIAEYPDANLVVIGNLIEDRDRFYPLITNEFVKIDIYIAFFVFVFLLILYSTKFYTYVNELSFAYERQYLDNFISIYLLWSTSLMAFLTLFRFSVVSRGYLIIYTFIVPLILMIFRNSEVISAIFGRSVTSETYISFNLDESSAFNNLRIITFRKKLANHTLGVTNNENEIIQLIDSTNKKKEVHLIILNIASGSQISNTLEEYLVNLNKKVLLISNTEIEYKNKFLYSTQKVNNQYLTYFNNDIQYGAKYILKRAQDVFLSTILLGFLSPVFIFISAYIYVLDSSPVIVKQKRVGLHGKIFTMYKFRSMKKDSHKLRDDLSDLNKHSGPLFKIKNDPRIIGGAQVLRKYSLDELPQLINVIKGDMSLVGPRPLFSEDTEFFDKNYMRRLNVLPGITGLLQINERNTSDFQIWYKYDIEYIQNWSLYLDLKILLKTPYALIKGNKIKGL